MGAYNKYGVAVEGVLCSIVSPHFVRWLFLVFVLIVACSSFLLQPFSEMDGVSGIIYSFLSMGVADIGYMTKGSQYPFVIAVSYSLSMIFAFVMALVFSVTGFPNESFAKVRLPTGWRRFGFLMVALLVIVMPVVSVMPVGSAQRTYHFFLSVSNNRIYIFAWSLCFMWVASLAWIVVFFEISRILKRNK